MSEQTPIEIADECEQRIDSYREERDQFGVLINTVPTHGTDLCDDLRRYAAHMRQQSARIAELETAAKKLEPYKGYFNEYADCLQKLCMDKLYKPCAPVSYKWPGLPHVESIRQAADFLLTRIAELERLVREAVSHVEMRRNEIERHFNDFDLGVRETACHRWLAAASKALETP